MPVSDFQKPFSNRPGKKGHGPDDASPPPTFYPMPGAPNRFDPSPLALDPRILTLFSSVAPDGRNYGIFHQDFCSLCDLNRR